MLGVPEYPNATGVAGAGGAGLIASSATIVNTNTIAGGAGGMGGEVGNQYFVNNNNYTGSGEREAPVSLVVTSRLPPAAIFPAAAWRRGRL